MGGVSGVLGTLFCGEILGVEREREKGRKGEREKERERERKRVNLDGHGLLHFYSYLQVGKGGGVSEVLGTLFCGEILGLVSKFKII